MSWFVPSSIYLTFFVIFRRKLLDKMVRVAMVTAADSRLCRHKTVSEKNKVLGVFFSQKLNRVRAKS